MSGLQNVAESPNPVAVRLTNVAKTYQLTAATEKLHRLPWTKKAPALPEFYALKDITLEIVAGRSLGIFGLNGAGKSTLLNLIAGNIRPTSGQIEVNGGVQLLQLTAGFTPELTARQNVVAYARARGISKDEITRRVEYVQEFADIGQFFDQPMQTYSSGMRARVAFGNAFAVDPEILIVDEALAVGDAVFVNKCFRRLSDARSRGTTFIYTSHSTDSIVRLCDNGMVLNKGELHFYGSAKEAAHSYSSMLHGVLSNTANPAAEGNSTEIDEVDSNESAATESKQVTNRLEFSETDDIDRSSQCVLYNPGESIFGTGTARIVDCKAYRNGKPAETNHFELGDTLTLIVRVFFHEDMDTPNLGFVLTSLSGECFYGTNQDWLGDETSPVKKGRSRQFRVSFKIAIASGPWFIDLAIANPRPPLQKRTSMLHFVVDPVDRKNTGPGWLDLDISPVGAQ